MQLTLSYTVASPLETDNGGFKRESVLSVPLPLPLPQPLLPDSIYGQCLNDVDPAASILMQQPLICLHHTFGK